MSWLAWYAAIGCAVVAALHLVARKSRTEDAGLRELLESFDDRPKSRGQRFLEKMLAPMAATAALVAVWPLAIVLKAREMRRARRPGLPAPEPEFTVRPGDLREALTREEIERREHVHDPLDAAPELPFGHLHAAWQRFVDATQPGDSLWSFTARSENRWRREELSGYVALRGKRIGPYFVCARRRLPG